MAVSGRYTAVLDACVLFPRLHRDILLSLAVSDLYTARWSVEIEKEWTISYKKKYKDAKIDYLLNCLRQAVPDALIIDYEEFISAIYLPDPNDRHVVAAAIRGNADAIVTTNIKDFPVTILEKYDIEVQTPDQFVLNQILLHPPRALSAIKRMRERWVRPTMTALDMVNLFEQRSLPQTAAHLRDLLDLI
jgi:predicted nucleic acid-binding protein